MRRRVAAIVVGLGIAALAIWLWQGARGRVGGSESGIDSVAERPPSEAVPGLAPRAGPATERAAGTVSEEDADEQKAAWLAWMKNPDRITGVQFVRSLEVVLVDAASGGRVAGLWSHWHAPVAAPFPPEFTEEEVEAQRRGMEKSLELWEASFRASGERVPEAIWRDEVDTTIQVRPPPGYVVLEESAQLVGAIAAGARHLVVVVPLHREAVLDVRVTGPDGRPAQGAELVALQVAGHDVSPVTEATGPGELRVRGIAQLPGEPVLAALDWGTAGVEEEAQPVEGIGSPQVTTTIPADFPASWSVEVRLAGPVGHLRDQELSDNDHPLEELLAPVAEDGAPRGRVRVKALGWDGAPAHDANVLGQPLNGQGEVLLENLPVGEVALEMKGTGRFPATASVFVKADTTTEVVLREPAGARLEVVVVDEDGRPRPFAKIRVDRPSFDLVGEQQRLDRFTDANGRRSLARVQAGTATVFANWGTRHGRATVTLRDGERASVRIVAK